MNRIQFWEILDRSRLNELPDPEGWAERLEQTLATLDASLIVEWNHVFDQVAADAYTVGLWGAAYVINGGVSDDGFCYFRCWLIGKGQKIHEAALENPDTLADVVVEDTDAEVEIHAAAHRAWMKVTGNPDTAPYLARIEKAELKGELWDFDDDEQVRKRIPRLAAFYGR